MLTTTSWCCVRVPKRSRSRQIGVIALWRKSAVVSQRAYRRAACVLWPVGCMPAARAAVLLDASSAHKPLTAQINTSVHFPTATESRHYLGYLVTGKLPVDRPRLTPQYPSWAPTVASLWLLPQGLWFCCRNIPRWHHLSLCCGCCTGVAVVRVASDALLWPWRVQAELMCTQRPLVACWEYVGSDLCG
jgi:hypothetical protein